FFFFSSRRRHTRFSRDWSSDVCSSDLQIIPRPQTQRPTRGHRSALLLDRHAAGGHLLAAALAKEVALALVGRSRQGQVAVGVERSEERRVGKEGRERWAAEL